VQRQPSIGKKMSYLLATGNLVSTSYLALGAPLTFPTAPPPLFL
jgi:hypothetical protein